MYSSPPIFSLSQYRLFFVKVTALPITTSVSVNGPVPFKFFQLPAPASLTSLGTIAE